MKKTWVYLNQKSIDLNIFFVEGLLNFLVNITHDLFFSILLLSFPTSDVEPPAFHFSESNSLKFPVGVHIDLKVIMLWCKLQTLIGETVFSKMFCYLWANTSCGIIFDSDMLVIWWIYVQLKHKKFYQYFSAKTYSSKRSITAIR